MSRCYSVNFNSGCRQTIIDTKTMSGVGIELHAVLVAYCLLSASYTSQKLLQSSHAAAIYIS